MNQVTQKDIAEALSVSRVTVTKALKDHPDIAIDTREKIKRKAEELGYTTNYVARSLSSRRTFSIGLIVPKIAHSFYSVAIETIHHALAGHDYILLPMMSFEDAETEKKNIEKLISLRVDGMIVDVSQTIKDASVFEEVRKRNIPLVFFDRTLTDNKFSSVTCDDRAAAKSAIEHSIRLGYTRIGHIAGCPWISIGRDRCAGYIDALTDNGLDVRDEWIVTGGFSRQDGYRGFMRLVENKHIPELVFAVTDDVAYGVYQAAAETGLSIPHDIGVIGFGDVEFAKLLTPPLTSVHMSVKEMAEKAVEILIRAIEHPEEDILHNEIIQAHIEIRDSIIQKKET